MAIMTDTTSTPTAPTAVQSSHQSQWPWAVFGMVAVGAVAAVAITSLVTNSWKNNAVQCCNPCAQATSPIQYFTRMDGNKKIPVECKDGFCRDRTDDPFNQGAPAPGDQKPGKIKERFNLLPSNQPTLPAGPRPEQGSPGILPSTQPRAPESQPRPPVENTVRPKLRIHHPHRHGRHSIRHVRKWRRCTLPLMYE
jgi:hypothetical protein